jgi:hypothetical protein
MSDGNGSGGDLTYWRSEAEKWRARANKRERIIADLNRDLAAARETITANEQAAAEWESTLGDLEQRIEATEQYATMPPDEKDKSIADLRRQLATRDRRDEWAKAVGDRLAPGVPLEDLWAKAEYEPGDDPADEATITEAVGKARDRAPYLFKPDADAAGDTQGGADAPRATATPAPRPVVSSGGGQGAPDRTPRRVTYTRAEVKTPGWQHKRPELAEAMTAGTAVMVDPR